MKPLKYIALIAALAAGLALTAKADLILSPFGDVPKNGTGIGGGIITGITATAITRTISAIAVPGKSSRIAR